MTKIVFMVIKNYVSKLLIIYSNPPKKGNGFLSGNVNLNSLIPVVSLCGLLV